LPAKIAASDDLHLAPLRDDGETYGTSTWILSALVDGALYVSAYNGKASRWNQAAKLRGTVQSCWARNRCERGACAAAGSAGNARIGPLASQTADYSIAEVADVRVGSSSSIMAPTRALLVNPNEADMLGRDLLLLQRANFRHGHLSQSRLRIVVLSATLARQLGKHDAG
jgi:hypothetical protein